MMEIGIPSGFIVKGLEGSLVINIKHVGLSAGSILQDALG